jgi:hypothetical protein
LNAAFLTFSCRQVLGRHCAHGHPS